MNANLTPDELAARYQLLCRSTQVDAAKDPQTQQIEVHLQALNKLLTHDLRALARRGSPDDFADIYFALEQELERFHEFCSFPALAQKFVVAFGGGFSAGKSSLINTLLGKRLLVTEVDPTTSLPTYLLKGEHDAVHAHNLFGHRIDLSTEEFLSLTHDEIERYGSNISRLLRSAFITRTDFPWENLALIDTPGYTKHEDQAQGARTDEHIARTQLNAAQAIVWVIDARKGCITEDDLQFLATVQADIPRLIVVSRADQKPAEEISAIVQGIKATLSERNLPFVDVIPVSARQKQEWPVEPIVMQLAAWSRQPRALRFAHNFKAQFTRYARFIEEEQRQAQRHLNRLNRILVMAESQDVQADAEELKQQAEDSLLAAKERAAELLGLRHRFFGDLKAIGDAVDIELPEPSEIDLLEIQGTDLLKLLTKQREQEGRSAPEESEALYELMKEGETAKLSSLIGNGLEAQLSPHIATGLDIHSRETYARLLAALLTAEGVVSDAQSQLFKALLGTLQLDDIRASLFAQAKNLDQGELSECHRIVLEHGLAKSCLLDALILCRVGKPLQASQIRLFSELSDYLGMTQKEAVDISSLTGYILGVHDKTEYLHQDIIDYEIWNYFIFEIFGIKLLTSEVNSGYYKVKGKKLIKNDLLIKNSVLVFEKNAYLEASSENGKKINLTVDNCIIFSAKITPTFNIEIRVLKTTFFGEQNENGIFQTYENGGIFRWVAVFKPTVFEIYKCKFIDCMESRCGEIKLATVVKDCEFLDDSGNAVVGKHADLTKLKSAEYSIPSHILEKLKMLNSNRE